jgi:hypothetical protein
MWPARFSNRAATKHAKRHRAASKRFTFALALALTTASLGGPELRAEPVEGNSQASGASNGGIASATTSGSEVAIDEITTGQNSGNVINMGDSVGSAELNGGEFGFPVELAITIDSGPQVADASGGDGGQAGTTPGDGTTDITIDNTDKNSNKNTSDSNAVINP